MAEDNLTNYCLLSCIIVGFITVFIVFCSQTDLAVGSLASPSSLYHIDQTCVVRGRFSGSFVMKEPRGLCFSTRNKKH